MVNPSRPAHSDPLDEATWLTEGLRSCRKRGTSPNEWRWQWPNPRNPQSEW
jgi:hypothetical protein